MNFHSIQGDSYSDNNEVYIDWSYQKLPLRFLQKYDISLGNSWESV